MTYSRSMSDSMMVGSAISNGNHGPNDIGWTGGSDRNGRALDEGREPRQMTDSPPSNGASHAGGNPPICQNCGTSTTPLWRRNELGATLCNACGLFLKLHGRARPLNLKTDTIKSRNRVKSVTQPKKKAVFDGSDSKHSPGSGGKHLNGHNGYSNGHLRIDQHPKSRPDMSRPQYDHYESSYSSQGYSYARSTASSTESGAEYSPPTNVSEPPKPYSPFYGAVGSPTSYPRGGHSPPFYPHAHHSQQAPTPLSLPPPTSHAERALPPPTNLLRESPPPRRDSPQLPPIFGLDTTRHLASHHPHSPLVPTKRESPADPTVQDQLDSLRKDNEQLRGRVNELEFVNDLMKSRVAELESSESKARVQVDMLKSDLLESQGRENELYRKMDRLRDELSETVKRRATSPDEESAKRRKVSLSEIVENRTDKVESLNGTEVTR